MGFNLNPFGFYVVKDDATENPMDYYLKYGTLPFKDLKKVTDEEALMIDKSKLVSYGIPCDKVKAFFSRTK